MDFGDVLRAAIEIGNRRVSHVDAQVESQRGDSYSLKFSDHISQHAIRWFER